MNRGQMRIGGDEQPGGDGDEKKEDEDLEPNPALETGKQLPSKMGDFPTELYGKPIEDLDDYYNNKYVSRDIWRPWRPVSRSVSHNNVEASWFS